jgi:hypothetical protein
MYIQGIAPCEIEETDFCEALQALYWKVYKSSDATYLTANVL